jgi:hypothetical protein
MHIITGPQKLAKKSGFADTGRSMNQRDLWSAGASRVQQLDELPQNLAPADERHPVA